MSTLAGQVDHVIGVDTRRDTNTAAVVDSVTVAALEHLECSTDALGYRRLVKFANQHAGARRVWAIEGTGSFGRRPSSCRQSAPSLQRRPRDRASQPSWSSRVRERLSQLRPSSRRHRHRHGDRVRNHHDAARHSYGLSGRGAGSGHETCPTTWHRRDQGHREPSECPSTNQDGSRSARSDHSSRDVHPGHRVCRSVGSLRNALLRGASRSGQTFTTPTTWDIALWDGQTVVLPAAAVLG